MKYGYEVMQVTLEQEAMRWSEDTVISCKHATSSIDGHFVNSKVVCWLDHNLVITVFALRHCLSFLLLLHRSVGLVLTVTYTTLLYGMYVPDWEYVITSPADTTPKHFMVTKN